MKITSITISKSRTIDIGKRIASDAFRKIIFSATAEISEGENYDKVRKELSDYVDLVINEEIEKIRDEHKKQLKIK